MNFKLLYSVLFFFFCFAVATAQDDELIIEKDSTVRAKKIVYNTQGIDPLSPSRAAFYSAVLPGLGQIYNKKYWKAPIVWAGIATGIYFYVDNDKEFNRYRTAFKLRKAGQPDEFTVNDVELISDDGLIRAQEVLKKNRDLSLFISIGLYALNILEANVDAHLPDKALDKNLSFRPSFFTEPATNQPMFGVTMNFNF